ncbi:positive regulator of sigma(E), RseC/MucC [Selenomonas sp. GACV-9]|uniref:SoxR reducing system RseC family protein n=1 Tax=Selenomonas sp. GACV-9 TaxID=3158782 RepID=UPI0008E0CC2C|nr:positive regulator of sigma(E), RseC/MucC [Selenomonas ruminantium]
MKQEQGLVVEVYDGLAKIKVGRHAECTSCGACPSSRQVMVEAVNSLGAQPGQRVRFALQEQDVLVGAFVVFVLPLLGAGLGAVAGWWLAPSLSLPEAQGSVGGAVIALVLALAFVRSFDRRVARRQEMKPVIVEILTD